MVKNLLVLKNELVTLEIGDIRSQGPGDMGGISAQIWETLSPGNWAGYIFSNIVPTSLWSSPAGTAAKPPAVTAKTLTVEDVSEQLDELLRQSIYAFTQRWGGLLNDATARKMGAKPIGKVEGELDRILDAAFGSQPEVVGKLKEAIQISAQAQRDAAGEKKGVRRY
jgi:conserved oligomeric Golgi complex subunit 3